MQQQALMKFDPATGETRPYPSHAEQWREWHGYGTAWLFNPWTGGRRNAGDVGTDVLGRLIQPPLEAMYAAIADTEARAAAEVERAVAAEREACSDYVMRQALACPPNSATRATLESVSAVLLLYGPNVGVQRGAEGDSA